jgi:inorganic pyrophosphatase
MDTTIVGLPARESDRLINVVVDTPKGSRNKYKYDQKDRVWRLSKVLTAGAVFPFNFGFVPSTTGEDGDPIDGWLRASSPLDRGLGGRAN